tara:strand:- start:14371 stop:15693 length:1323 start_codon:yes stop_codon:yes gene_type:complete
MKETIVASATPAGRGGVSIIRISGRGAKDVGVGLCGNTPKSWSFIPCSIKNKEGVFVDSGLLAFFEAPRSYTGEDVIEVHCHGNPVIVDSIIEAAVSLGARIAEPGEFTKRAFLNDKIDLAQAESVADLIAAKTSSAVVSANSSLVGDFSKLVNKAIDSLVDSRVLVEACLDFSDEDSVALLENKIPSVREGVMEVLGTIESLLKVSLVGAKMREGLRVVVLGPPNSGKSTLINRLAKEDVAIVSQTPGTTRDLLRVDLDLGGLPVEFVDTAGLHDNSNEEIELEGMRRAISIIGSANLVVLMSVVGEDFSPSLADSVKTLRVFNKIDKEDSFVDPGTEEVFISALKGTNLNGFISSVFSNLEIDGGVEVPVLARQRHLSCLEGSKGFLESAVSNIDGGGDLALVAEDLREASLQLGLITRPVTSDDLLGHIFSEFCVGK